MQQVGQKSRREVQTERMNSSHADAVLRGILRVADFRLLQKLQIPVDHGVLGQQLNDILCHSLLELRCVLRAHLLQDGNLESLSHRAVFLLGKKFNDAFHDGQVGLAGLWLSQVLNTLRHTDENADERRESMLQAMTIHVQHHHDKVQLLCLSDLEDVYIDELHDEVPALVWRNLQSVHT